MKKVILSSLAVGRNSFVFWYNEDIKNGGDLILLAKGRWKDDINQFIDSWNDPSNHQSSFGQKWKGACSQGAWASEKGSE
jgi:hypothetical protein